MKNAKKVLQFPFINSSALDNNKPHTVMPLLLVINELREVLELLNDKKPELSEIFSKDELVIIATPFLNIPDNTFLEKPAELLSVLSPLPLIENQRLVAQIYSLLGVLSEMNEYPDLHLLVPFY